MKRKLWLVLILMVCFLSVGCKSGPAQGSKVIGEVNGDKITQAEYDQHLKILKLYYEQQRQAAQTGGEAGQNTGAKLDDVKDKAIIDQLKKETWDELILQKIILQQAAKVGVEVTDKELDEATKTDDYKKFVKDNNMDEQLFRQSLKTQYSYSKLKKNVTGNIDVSDTDIKNYYDSHLSEFQEEGGIQISHILVATEKEANDILAQLKAGADFATLAKKYSTCGSKAQGGYLGLGNENQSWVKEFKDAALKLKPGEMTQAPVKSQFGYHIIKAGERKEASTRTLQQARNEIVVNLQKQKEDKAFEDYLQNLKKKAKINDLRPKELK